MLQEVLKNVLYANHKPQDIVHFFVSLYDDTDHLLASQGLLQASKPLAESLDLMMHGVLQQYEQQTHTFAIDIVDDVKEEADITTLLAYSPAKYGICLVSDDGSKSGVILPNTMGIKDMKQAIQLCQQKNDLPGKVLLYSFRTQRSSYVLASA